MTPRVKVGDKVVLTVDRNQYHKKGEVCVVTTVNNGVVYVRKKGLTGTAQIDVNSNEYKLFQDNMESLTEHKAMLEEVIKEIDAKIAWLTETGEEVVDPEVYKVWKIIKSIEDHKDDSVALAKSIVDIYNG